MGRCRFAVRRTLPQPRIPAWSGASDVDWILARSVTEQVSQQGRQLPRAEHLGGDQFIHFRERPPSKLRDALAPQQLLRCPRSLGTKGLTPHKKVIVNRAIPVS